MSIRILYLLDFFEGPFAGTERQLDALITGLDRSRFEPRLAVLRETEYVRRGAYRQAVEVVGVQRMLSVGSLWRLFRFARRMRREGVRVVHLFFNDSALVAPLFFRLAGIRVVAGRRDMGYWYTPLLLGLLRVSNLFVDRLVTNSQAVMQNVHEREAFPLQRIEVIYNGFASGPCGAGPAGGGVRAELGIPPHAPVVGIVANLRAVKRVQDLVQAMAAVVQRFADARLVAVGEGEELEALRTLADELGIGRSVHFVGRRTDPERFVAAFSVGVLCSESEGLSNAIIEYMDAGKPVVCTDVGGNRELVRDGETGLRVPVAQPRQLADAICGLLEAPARARDMGAAGRRMVRDNLSMRAMLDAHMRLYDDLIR